MIVRDGCAASDVAYVFSHLWERGYKELDCLGLSWHDARALLTYYARTGLRSQTLFGDDRPVLVVGIARDNGEWITWFQATERFAAHAGEITRHIRREAAAHQGPLYIYSVCAHPQAARWFHVLGFDPDGGEKKLQTGATLRRFARR